MVPGNHSGVADAVAAVAVAAPTAAAALLALPVEVAEAEFVVLLRKTES